jgi:hypothetical protein
MDNSPQFERDPLLTVKDQPHREMTATRAGYGLPQYNKSDDGVSFSEKSSSESDVIISRINIQEVEVTFA